jgi:hypothetical protein
MLPHRSRINKSQYWIRTAGAGAIDIYNTRMDPEPDLLEPEPQLIYEAKIRIRIATMRIRAQSIGAGMTL